MADQEIQEAIRQFDPVDTETHRMWTKLLRAYSLTEIIATIPFEQIPVSQILKFVAHGLEALEKNRTAQRAVIKKMTCPTWQQTKYATTTLRSFSGGGVFPDLASLLIRGSDLCQDGATHVIDCVFEARSYDSELELSVASVREETAEETNRRKAIEAEQKKKQEAAAQKRRDTLAKKKTQQELNEQKEYERLKKKYEGNK